MNFYIFLILSGSFVFLISAFKITSRIEENNINDTILEVFNFCTCVIFYQCEEINHYIIATRINKKKKAIACSDPNYLCCHSPEEPTTTSTTPKITTTTSEVEILTVKPKNPIINTTLEKLQEVCGMPKTVLSVRVLNTESESENTINGEFPWMIEIFQHKRLIDLYKFKCGGSLIHPQVVLTANHCVRSALANELRVVAPKAAVFQNLGEDPKSERLISEIIKHPGYYSGGLFNDIALLILTTPYQFKRQTINSICLPSSENLKGKICLAMGWGENPTLSPTPLKKVDVPIVDFGQCQNLLRKTRLGEAFKLHSSFICAGGEKGKDTCKGDGGGPLVCLGDDYRFVQVGIVSWGINCGVVNEPGVYTDVAHFKNWIHDELLKHKINL